MNICLCVSKQAWQHVDTALRTYARHTSDICDIDSCSNPCGTRVAPLMDAAELRGADAALLGGSLYAPL